MSQTQDRFLSLHLSQAQGSCLPPVNGTPNIPPPPPPPPPLPAYRASIHEKPSLNFPGRIEKKLAEYNASQSVYKRWLFEIVSVTTSAICMGAIIAILHHLNNKSLSAWPFGLTIITILSKVASAALILPISEAIGQLKWTWFHGKKSRDAFDFEIFDKASRGAWGSVMLLFRTKGRSLAALGALLTILLLAIDTFFQQVTDLPERWRLQGESFIPRVVRYEPNLERQYEDVQMEPMFVPNNQLGRGIGPFFYDQNGTRPLETGNSTQAEIPLVCPTGRCEWPSYQTLGVCSACDDVSHLLEYACLTTKMDWIRSVKGGGLNQTYPKGPACGYFLNATSDNPVLMSGYRVDNFTNPIPGETLLMRTLPLVTSLFRETLYGGTINFDSIQYRILDALIVSSADGSANSVYEKKPPVAQECMLTWCVKTLRSPYDSGDYREEVEDTFINTTRAEWPWRTEHNLAEEITTVWFLANASISPPALEGSKMDFGVSNDTFVDTIFMFDEMFPSMITVSNPAAPPFMKIRVSNTKRITFRSVRFSPWLAPNNVSHHLERMAQAITNVIRSDTDSSDLVAGTAWARETYVAVHWGWLAFPLAMLLLSIIFLISTILKTSSDNYQEIGTWKTSAMPTLMYSLPNDVQRDITSATHPKERISKDREKVRIRLLPKQGWRVSGQLHARPTPPPGFI